MNQPLPLRDIHLPAAVSAWPPAIGWWLAALLALVLLATLWWSWRRWQRRRFRRLGLQQLERIEQHWSHNPAAALTELSQLLRQLAVLHHPQHDCAGLHGEAWLRFLDQPFSDQPFSHGIGQRLALGPYQRPDQTLVAAGDEAQLLSLCRRWIKALPPSPKRQQPGGVR